VSCVACGHEELLAPDRLRIKGLRLPPFTPVLDLEPRLRCRECDARGKAVVSIKWAAATQQDGSHERFADRVEQEASADTE
jgi:hypothetical protein